MDHKHVLRGAVNTQRAYYPIQRTELGQTYINTDGQSDLYWLIRA